MNDNELLATTEVETFTFSGDQATFTPNEMVIEPIDPVTLLVIPADDVLPAAAPEPVPMCWATDGGASFSVNAFDFYYALMGEQLFEIFHLVPYDAALYG